MYTISKYDAIYVTNHLFFVKIKNFWVLKLIYNNKICTIFYIRKNHDVHKFYRTIEIVYPQ